MLYHLISTSDFPGGSVVKNPLANNAGDTGSIPGSGRSPGEMATPAPVFLPGIEMFNGCLHTTYVIIVVTTSLSCNIQTILQDN